MKPTPNKFRFIESDHDYHQYWQCLKCKEPFCGGGVDYNWKYCPLCGTKWDGQLECKEKGDRLRPKYKEPDTFWVLQEMRVPTSEEFITKEDNVWKDIYAYDTHYSAKMVLEELKLKRAEANEHPMSWVTWDYRVIIAKNPNCSTRRWYGD